VDIHFQSLLYLELCVLEQVGLPFKSRQALLVAAKHVGQYLDGDLAIEFVVLSEMTSPIPPAPIFSMIR